MGVYIWNNNPRLPAEYQEVEYIQNSGNLYINSGFAPNQDTKAELKFSNWTESGSNDVFGTDKNFANSGFTLLPTVPCYGNQTIDVAKNVGDGNLHTITLGKDGYVVDGELITTFNTQTFTSLNLYLFALNRNGGAREYAHYRFYYMKIWDNGTLARDFIPCYRKSDDVIGLYDLVNSQFYTKSGSGTFTKGSDVIYFEKELQNAYIGEYHESHIVEGYYDAITDSFYSDANLTNLITPRAQDYYKYIRYTTPVYYKYVNGHYEVQKKNETTVTKNTTFALGSSFRKEGVCWDGKGIGIVTCGSGTSSGTIKLLKRTDIDTVEYKSSSGNSAYPYGYFCATKQGTFIGGIYKSGGKARFGVISVNYDSGTTLPVNTTTTSLNTDWGFQGSATVNNATTFYMFQDSESTYKGGGMIGTIDSSGQVSAYTILTNLHSYTNICGGTRCDGKVVLQPSGQSYCVFGTPSSAGTQFTWETSTHSFSSANSIGSDRKNQIFVGGYNSTTMKYSFDKGATWSSLTAAQNTGGQIWVDEIGDIWYGTETNTSNLGWIRFGDFKTESELS